MTDQEMQIIEALMQAAPPIIEANTVVKNRCIFATGIGLQTLKYFKIKAEAYPCRVAIWNESYDKLLRDLEAAKKMSKEELLSHKPWIRIIDSTGTGPGWSGHLVIRLAPDLLLDLDSQQLARPDKNIFVPAPATLIPRYSEETGVYLVFEGTSVQYAPHDNPVIAEQYKNTPDWKGQNRRDRHVIGAVIRAVKKILETQTHGELHGSG